MVEWPKASTVFDLSNTEIAGWKHAPDTEVCLRFFCVVLSCVGRGFASG
jgi:hypothetical protein